MTACGTDGSAGDGGRILATGERAGADGAVGAAETTLARVLLHGVVDEIVDAAFELARHLLEVVPQHVAALECPGTLLVGIRAHEGFVLVGRAGAG